VRQKRRRLGLSQEAFADSCELDRTYVGGIERGERNVALVNIEKIASALHVRLSELFRRI
jgi:transcriptional regulator with XRE-family HTH domain